jgi:hypothetical protein
VAPGVAARSHDPDMRLAGIAFLPIAGLILGAGLSWAQESFRPAPAPRFPTSDPARWIGAPAAWESLRGRVVLLDVWTFG